MELVQHQGAELPYVVVRPDGYDPSRRYPTIVLLHGFGANMFDLAGLAPAIEREGYLYLFPNAPRAVALGPGIVGYSWTEPQRFSDPLEAAKAQGLVERFVQAEVLGEQGAAPGGLVLGGFSQGAGLAYRCGLSRPDLYAGLVALSGAVFDAQQLGEHLPATRAQPLFIAHGVKDPMVPVERARQTRAFLEQAGYRPEYREYDMGHEVSQELLDDLVPWLHRVLPPLATVGQPATDG